jgi:hypothetical protein
MGTGGSFPEVKRPRREADRSPPTSVQARKVELYLHSPIRLLDVVAWGYGGDYPHALAALPTGGYNRVGMRYERGGGERCFAPTGNRTMILCSPVRSPPLYQLMHAF